MPDFRHSGGALVWRRFAANQFVLQMNLNHLPHQAVSGAANRGNLLQNGHTGFARFQRPRERFNLAADAPYPAEGTLFNFRSMWHGVALHII